MRPITSIITLGLALLLASAASAESSSSGQPFYAGASWVDTTSLYSRADFQDSPNLKVFVGYRLNPKVAFEGAYRDLGKATFLNFVDRPPTVLESDGYSLVCVVSWPWQRFVIFGSFGTLWWSRTGQRNDSTHSDWIGGFGLRMNLGQRFALRAEWERADFVFDTEFPSLGLELRF